MFAKLLMTILLAGAIAAYMLQNRHERLEAAHRIAVLHHEHAQQQRTLWQLELEIARSTRPDEIRDLIEPLEQHWVSLPDPVDPALISLESALARARERAARNATRPGS